MLRAVFVSCFLLISAFPVSAQSPYNNVPNPSFEDDSMAPPITAFNWNHFADWKTDSLYSQPGNALYLSKYWFQPTGGTPDFLNSRKSNLLGFKTKTARTGNGRMGIITGIAKHGLVTALLYKDTYAEYIECRLLHPLDT